MKLLIIAYLFLVLICIVCITSFISSTLLVKQASSSFTSLLTLQTNILLLQSRLPRKAYRSLNHGSLARINMKSKSGKYDMNDTVSSSASKTSAKSKAAAKARNKKKASSTATGSVGKASEVSETEVCNVQCVCHVVIPQSAISPLRCLVSVVDWCGIANIFVSCPL